MKGLMPHPPTTPALQQPDTVSFLVPDDLPQFLLIKRKEQAFARRNFVSLEARL
jgi:hypothetical protein